MAPWGTVPLLLIRYFHKNFVFTINASQISVEFKLKKKMKNLCTPNWGCCKWNDKIKASFEERCFRW